MRVAGIVFSLFCVQRFAGLEVACLVPWWGNRRLCPQKVCSLVMLLTAGCLLDITAALHTLFRPCCARLAGFKCAVLCLVNGITWCVPPHLSSQSCNLGI